MWVFSTSPTNLSFIGSLTTEIYYRAGITGKTDTHTHTHTHSQTYIHTYIDTYIQIESV